MLFAEIVGTSREVAGTRARLQKIARLAECMRRLGPEERHAGVAFLTGELRQGRIGLGYAAVRDSMPGSAAPAPQLGVAKVDLVFSEIASRSGPGSGKEKLQRLGQLLSQATEEEQEFLARLVFGELRQGAQEGIVVEAVARAASLPAASVRRAVMLSGDLRQVAVAALTGGEGALTGFRLQLLSPVQPMLAQTAKDLEEVFGRHGRVGLEYKLDGARVQVHRIGGDVRVFTRKLNDVTAAVPEVVEVVRALPATRLILDGEAIALTARNRPAPFQTTMRRFGRRLKVDEMKAELPLSSFFFDCLHLDGQDLIDLPGSERGAALNVVVPEAARVPALVTAAAEEARVFIDDALQAGHEGVMAKDQEAPYEAGRRGAGWMKLQPSHTLDLVVLAVEWGSGRRRGWLSNLHLGALDEAGGFTMLGKTFKGMTDEMLRWQTEKLQELKVGEEGHVLHVRPELVVEVAFDGVQASPQYPGGMALRFARVKRYRPDKGAAQADTVAAVREIFSRSRLG